jgi:hypothetical protein
LWRTTRLRERVTDDPAAGAIRRHADAREQALAHRRRVGTPFARSNAQNDRQGIQVTSSGAHIATLAQDEAIDRVHATATGERISRSQWTS